MPSEKEINYYDQEGQMTFSMISTRTSNSVVQANPLIKARQNLTLNQKKLISVIIMQIIADDVDFKPYELSPSELSNMLGQADSSNLYHRSKEMCDSLMSKKLEITQEDGSWEKYQWVQHCKYNAKTKKIEIMLNTSLRPFLLGLVKNGYYTQYELRNVLDLHSIYAVRIFELIQEKIKRPGKKPLPMEGLRVKIDKQTIIDACMLYQVDGKDRIIYDEETKKPKEKYPKLSRFKEIVIKKACEEISANTDYYVPYASADPEKCVKFEKKGRDVVAFSFYVNTHSHEPHFLEKVLNSRTG